MKKMKDELERIVAVLLENQTVALADLRNMLVGYNDREIGLTIWHAREDVRRGHGIDFAIMRGAPGHLTRCEPSQIARRGIRYIAKGTRAQGRGLERLHLAAASTKDEAEKLRLERAADREQERRNYRRLRSA